MTRKFADCARHRAVTCFFLALIACSPGISQPLTAGQIFDRMLRVYATAQTYQDKGIVTTNFYKPGSAELQNQIKRIGTTAYDRRTDRFRFQYEEVTSFFGLPNRYLIWSDGKSAKSWWTMGDSVNYDTSLSEELSAATGVSGTLSRKISGLLLTDTICAGWGIDSLCQLTYLGTGTLGSRLCYRLSGRFRGDQTARLWIDQKTFLILGIDESTIKLPNDVGASMSIRYEPTVNRPVADEAFVFDPPRYFWLWFRPVLKSVLSLVGYILIFYGLRRFRKSRSASPTVA